MSEQILRLIPAPGAVINWPAILKSKLSSVLSPLATIPQNPIWHGEGDALTHTKMVCESLVSGSEWPSLPERDRQILFLAALLHDIGKVSCTRQEDGVWVSPHHASTGASIARRMLWLDFDLCGTAERLFMRETICQLIQAHMAPVRVAELPMPERKVIQMSADGHQTVYFTNRLLKMLAKADTLGRIAEDTKKSLDAVDFFNELALEQNCLDTPYPFVSSFDRYTYLSCSDRWPGASRYDDRWGRVIMLSGLPGVGKDTYIHHALSHLPVISLDDIREELHISPRMPQGQVISVAKERATELLRKKQPFVWNATNLTPLVRKKQVALFQAYGASTQIVYLETSWQEQLYRNASRSRTVPERALLHMLEQLSPPLLNEAQEISWLCV